MKRAALLLLAAGIGIAAPAQAQFKKLKGAVTKAAASAAGNSAGLVAGAVQFDEDVLEITPERLDTFLLALEVEVRVAAQLEAQDIQGIERENAARRQAYEAQVEAWEKRRKAREACGEREAETHMSGARVGEREMARIEAAAKRMEAAHARGDAAEFKRLSDSLMKVAGRIGTQATNTSNAMQSAVVANCGLPEEKPPRPAMIPIRQWSEVTDSAAGTYTPKQYGILRERIAPYVVSGGKSNEYVYTSREAAALKAALPALAKYRDILRQG